MLVTMDFQGLTETIQQWEEDGSLAPGEAIVVGQHEPNPLPGALRVDAVSDERFIIQMLDESGDWNLLRRYETEDEAADFAFRRLAQIDAERYWGIEAWNRIRGDARRGSILRTAALLLVPKWDIELDFDRWDLADRLREFGVAPRGRYWIEGVDGLPQPEELVWQLRRGPDGEWVVGKEERGSFRVRGRFTVEAHACQWLFREIVTHEVTAMGSRQEPPHIVPKYRAQVRDALTEALGLVTGGPVSQ